MMFNVVVINFLLYTWNLMFRVWWCCMILTICFFYYCCCYDDYHHDLCYVVLSLWLSENIPIYYYCYYHYYYDYYFDCCYYDGIFITIKADLNFNVAFLLWEFLWLHPEWWLLFANGWYSKLPIQKCYKYHAHKKCLQNVENRKEYSAREKRDKTAIKKRPRWETWQFDLVIFPPLAKNFSKPSSLIQGLPKTSSSKGLILYNSHISACGKSHVWKDT